VVFVVAGFSSCQSLHWPSVIDGGWDQRFGPKTKLLLLDALILMTLAHPVTEGALRSVAVRLYGVWCGEDMRVRGCVGRLIGAVVPALQHLGYADFMQGSQTVLLTELQAAAARGTNNPDGSWTAWSTTAADGSSAGPTRARRANHPTPVSPQLRSTVTASGEYS
jgi:hypothetical protein